MDGQFYVFTHLDTPLQLPKEKTRSSKAGLKGSSQAEVASPDGQAEGCSASLASLASHGKPGEGSAKSYTVGGDM